MFDARVEKLADVIVSYSTNVQTGENVLIEAFDIPDNAVNALVNRVAQAGGRPFVSIKHNAVLRSLYINATEEQMELIGKLERDRMKEMSVYIGVRGSHNIAEHSDVSDDKMKMYRKYWWNPVHSDQRVKHTKWVVLRYPSSSMAQQANMSTEQFEKFYFDVCTFDYSKMAPAIIPLVSLMDKTDEVRISGPDTDLTFSIKDIPAIPCIGNMNIPDGECFTAPVKNSVNGKISFNAPTVYQGTVFEGITLSFRDGKIIDAFAAGSNSNRLNEILDSDEGSRYIGEFSFGFNPFVVVPMKDILFDEKIAGSFHFTPGQAYEEADNGNRSVVHWDMVMLQREEQGGGAIYFDGKLVRKDGLFVLPELFALNPENLKSA